MTFDENEVEKWVRLNEVPILFWSGVVVGVGLALLMLAIAVAIGWMIG